MIRILHAADLHLDSPFAALSPELAIQRRQEQRDIIWRLTTECDSRGCDLLLLAGDLFDSEHVFRETAEQLCEALGTVRARVFIAPGNHDPFSPASLYATLPWPENVHIFRSRAIEAVHLENPAVHVYGAAFTEPRETGLLENFLADADELPKIMVMHGAFGVSDSVYNPIREEAVAASGLDYLALGHAHKMEARTVGKTTVGNPGFAMSRGFDELGPGCALFVELDGDDCRVEAVNLGGRVYQSMEISVGADPLADIMESLPEETSEDIYRITLVGTCPAPDMAGLYAELSPHFYGLELIDKTLPPQDLWKDLEEDSLKGEFLRQLKSCYDAEDAGEDDRRLVARAARLGLALMEGREVPEL